MWFGHGVPATGSGKHAAAEGSLVATGSLDAWTELLTRGLLELGVGVLRVGGDKRSGWRRAHLCSLCSVFVACGFVFGIVP